MTNQDRFFFGAQRTHTYITHYPLLSEYNFYLCYMEIYIESLFRSGIVVGVEYFAPDEKHDHYEFSIFLLFIRIVIVWN